VTVSSSTLLSANTQSVHGLDDDKPTIEELAVRVLPVDVNAGKKDCVLEGCCIVFVLSCGGSGEGTR